MSHQNAAQSSNSRPQVSVFSPAGLHVVSHASLLNPPNPCSDMTWLDLRPRGAAYCWLKCP